MKCKTQNRKQKIREKRNKHTRKYLSVQSKLTYSEGEIDPSNSILMSFFFLQKDIKGL